MENIVLSRMCNLFENPCIAKILNISISQKIIIKYTFKLNLSSNNCDIGVVYCWHSTSLLFDSNVISYNLACPE